MPKSEFKVYSNRWLMLIVYMLMVAVNQMLWITFAPITGDATIYYGVSDLKIGILSMCFMIVYIAVSIPASWIIDKYGYVKPRQNPPVGEGVGNYGREFYTSVFELLLRMKANYLWPAMWNNAFNEDDPENPLNARLFNVKSLPANYLFDPEGKIIGSNLHGKTLQIKLNQLFIK